MLLRRLLIAGSLITRLLPALGAGVAVALALLSVRKGKRGGSGKQKTGEDLP